MSTILTPNQRSTFVAGYNRSCFLFDHRLHEHAIFDLPNLVELSKRLPDSYWSTVPPAVHAGWGNSADRRRSLPETLETIAESNSLVLLKGLAEDPEFAPLYHAVLEELQDQLGDVLRADISIGRATIIVSSPGRVTPYHIDGEVNFLLQLRGEKRVNVFDPNDRTLLTEAELEAFYAGDFSAAQYKENRQSDAYAFDFQPGRGVHVPLHAPHWTRNGSSVSVALSLNCSLRSNAKAARIYRCNHYLRKRGFSPLAPGISHWQDGLKAAVGGGVDLAFRLAHR